MKIILGHNFYQLYGGEDHIFTTEAAVLAEYGHQVVQYTTHNQKLAAMNPLQLTKATIWHQKSYQELRALLHQEKPDIIHLHNTFPLISPAAYYAARAEGIPVVQNIQNYRLLCPTATFLRAGKVCEDCLGQWVPWPAVLHACYRQDRSATAVVTLMLTLHRLWRTWQNMVDLYIAATEFAKQKFIQGGLPADKIVVKPNLVHPDPGIGARQGKYALFVGRLSSEKGLDTLLTAWERLAGKQELKIVGDGPLGPQVAEAATRLPGIEWLGQLPNQRVLDLMKEAYLLLFPSICYEGLPMVIAEAFAVGLPVIASNLGAMSSLIDAKRTGLHFHPGDAAGLANQIEWSLEHPAEIAQMSLAARREFETHYLAECNYEKLMAIYQLAIERYKS
jgi:glycosyltransferase involved in cell wall biosynthesis